MDKKNEFKNFISNHPEILKYIKNKETTWQELYEIYDIYGDSDDAWDKYFNDNSVSTKSLGELTNIFKNINMDNIQKHITNAQKAVNLIQELTNKDTTSIINKTPRPITKFFGD